MAFHIFNDHERQVLAGCSAFHAIPRTHHVKRIAIAMITLLLMVLICLIFVPWQQSVSGIGKVSVYSPMERPQAIEAFINGRITHWYVKEGQQVKKGAPLLELSEIDPKYLDPNQLQRLESQQTALLNRQQAILIRIQSLKGQEGYLSQSRGAAIPSARAKLMQANHKVDAALQALKASQQNTLTANLNLKRIQELHTKGLRSTRDLELAQQSYIDAETKLEQAQSYLDVARQEKSGSYFDQNKVVADTGASLSSIQASISSAYESLASTNSDLSKLEIDIYNLKHRINQRTILAPKDGIVVRILNVGSGETVAEGELLATLMPTTSKQEVELFISDNDAPLVSVGKPVRLQFAGWPAIQFSGWPSVAVGTFAGRVSVIDAIDDGTGRYRIWVEADKELIVKGKEQPWPSPRFLRPGSKAVGWIMLDTVPLWFELWRQFNAFPQTVNMEHLKEIKSNASAEEKTTDVKKPKKK